MAALSRHLPLRSRASTRCVAGLVSLALLLVGAFALAAAGKVNVNAASAAELQQVPGLDANLAVRIVAHRASAGPFHKLDDLLEVPGFTKMMMISAADHLEIGPVAASTPAAPMGSAAANGKKLDLNRATFRDLLLLPEMTPRGAKSIVDYRDKNHGFQSVDELDRVPGLDKRLIVQLVDQVEVTSARPAATAVAAAPTPAAAPTGDTVTLGEGGWNGSWVSKIEATPTPAPDPQETPKPALAPGEKIDLNAADRTELERLPDIGPVMSQRIVEYRGKNGPFKSLEGLLQVRGIGAQRLAAIRQYASIGKEPKATIAKATPRPKATPAAVEPKATPRATVAKADPTPRPTQVAKADPSRGGKAILPDGRVNINVAGIDDLLTLPRMTRDAASEIVAFRAKNGPFHDAHGITDVPSIGEATYARIREKITVE